MLGVLRSTWPLLAGVMLLMVGNGMQGTLLGIRGSIEGIPTGRMAIVMSGYFGGFVLGSLVVPRLIQGVGHVRVFAALGSLISAVLILYAAAPNWIAWVLLRLMIGFSFCGVYITAESWMNASAGNETRGRAMSAYFIVQMAGLVVGQVLVNVSDPGGWMLFVIPSVLVSLAFTPILLTQVPAPRFETIAPMRLSRLYAASPLGCVGIFLIGGVFSALLGMGAVWGTQIGLNVRDISAFMAAIWIGGLLAQYPVGWMSDRYDRRRLIVGLSALGAAATLAVVVTDTPDWVYLPLAAVLGGVANPIYALLIAYTNDRLDTVDMPAASAGLLLINGGGSVFGPILTGWLMSALGPDGFWAYMSILLAGLTTYAGWRITRRAAPAVDQSFAVLSPSATMLAVETALAGAGDPPSAQSLPEEQSRMPTDQTPQTITSFWLDEIGPKGWYAQDDAVDAAIRNRFLQMWQDAETLAPRWAAQGPDGALAALILTDQFPRNTFREDPRAFATDALARQIAEKAIAAGHDTAIPVPARQFFYLPFEHSEALADQHRAVALFTERMPGENLRHAELHRDTIARFGRFPWRNKALGRHSTATEQRILDAGGYGALVSGRVSLAEGG